MARLSQLIQTTPWAEIQAALMEVCPDAETHLRDYQQLAEELRCLQPSSSSMRISIAMVDLEDPPGGRALDVTGSDGTLNRQIEGFEQLLPPAAEEYGRQEAKFSLCLRPRAEWLGMAIDDRTMVGFSAAEIIAACLYEMSFHGFDEAEVVAFSRELEQRADQLSALSADEKTRVLVPVEAYLAMQSKGRGDQD